MIVLDTNVISELMRPVPEDRVSRWTRTQPTASLCVTSITQAEILHGVLLLPKGKRQDLLQAAAIAMFEVDLGGRILPFDTDAALQYARIAVDRRRAGRPISHFDAQIAAIARAHGAAVATRNTADFGGCGVEVIDPWE
ncbi:MAG: type II toxin-antitoxin system VapC family toxin [Deltaproteobacteria bacterium]|nr:type II toxin-antitoxin system VapC family toxin [Deltaproteobacteria bacterium]